MTTTPLPPLPAHSTPSALHARQVLKLGSARAPRLRTFMGETSLYVSAVMASRADTAFARLGDAFARSPFVVVL